VGAAPSVSAAHGLLRQCCVHHVHGLPYIAVNSEVDRAYEARYAGQGQPLREVVSPEVRRFTMRVTPRG
jgi:hypothetical protein